MVEKQSFAGVEYCCYFPHTAVLYSAKIVFFVQKQKQCMQKNDDLFERFVCGAHGVEG